MNRFNQKKKHRQTRWTALLFAVVWFSSQGFAGSALPWAVFASAPAAPGALQVVEWSVLPWALPKDHLSESVIRVQIDDPGGGSQVELDLAPFGVQASMSLYDDGIHNDDRPGDGIYGGFFVVPDAAPLGEVALLINVTDGQGNLVVQPLGDFLVLAPLTAPWPATLPAAMGWGSFEKDWQAATGLDWDYTGQFVTWSWQDWDPNFVQKVVENAWDADLVPVLTVNMLMADEPCPGLAENDCYLAHLLDPVIMEGYFARLQVAAQQARGDRTVIFHLETDGTAYAHRYTIEHQGENGVIAGDPNTVPALSMDPAFPNTFAGFMQRMVAVIRQEAPNALIALHARSWATGVDIAASSNPDLDVKTIAEQTAAFLLLAGGPELDLLMVDWKNMNAGSGLSPWWDPANRTLPHFNRTLHWQNWLSHYANRRLLLWRVPAGNMNLDNTCDRYQDNRIDYAFGHTRDLVSAGIVGIVIGGGADCQTDPSTDGGNIQARASQYYSPPPAPDNLTLVGLPTPGSALLQWEYEPAAGWWGFRIYLGSSPDNLAYYADVQARRQASILPPGEGTWFAAVTAYDALGNESPLALPVSFTSLKINNWLYMPIILNR